MLLGWVGLSLPQAVRTPTPSSAVASVNACFCIGTLPRLRWGSEEQIVSSGMRPRCSSGHPDVSALFRRSSSRHHGALTISSAPYSREPLHELPHVPILASSLCVVRVDDRDARRERTDDCW